MFGLFWLFSALTKVYSIVRSRRPYDRTHTCFALPPAQEQLIVPKLDLSLMVATSDYIVVLDFPQRKLAFVFQDGCEAQRFKLCMEILAKYVKSEQVGK